MKVAAIMDIWRMIRRSGKRAVKRLEVTWSGIPRLTDGCINIVQPITLICGENGAGKSSILHTIFHAIASEQHLSEHGGYTRPLGGAIDSVCVEIAGAPDPSVPQIINDIAAVKAYFSPDGELARVALIDAGMHIPAMLDYVKKDGNFGDHLDGVDAARFEANQLEEAGFIIGRAYRSISIFEILDSSFGAVLPYFRADAQGASYDAPDMGYGELAVLYIVWTLGRLPVGSLVLIEEPETFLSPRAQIALVDVLASYVKSRQLSFIVTSHSGPIAERLQNSEIVYVTRSAGRVTLHAPARTADLVARLGLKFEKIFILFVEDQAGEIFARTLIDQYSDRLAGNIECVRCNGDANVLRAINAIPQGIKAVAHIAVLDGDQRDSDKVDPRVVCLPGTEAPEAVLRAYTESVSEAELSGILGVEATDLAKAMAHADGDNLHDWSHTMSNSLGIPYPEFIRRLIIAWSKVNSGDVEQFVRAIESFSVAA